ncbi:MAG: hypothetical protein AB7T63_12500 [Planctomycetota bacterium]
MRRVGAPLLLLLVAVVLCHGRVVMGAQAGDARVALGARAGLTGPLLGEDLAGRATWLTGPPVGEGTWRPAASLLHAAQVGLFGPEGAAGFHATSLLLFLALAVLLVRLGVDAGLAPGVAATATALFACHPATVEMVAYAPAQAVLAATVAGVLAARLASRPTALAQAAAIVAYAVVLLLEPVALVVPWLGWWLHPTRSRPVALGWLACLFGWVVVRIALPGVQTIPALRPAGEALTTTAGLLPTAAGWWLLPHGLPYGTAFPLPFEAPLPRVVAGAGVLLTGALLGALPGLLAERARRAVLGLLLGWVVLVPGFVVAEPLLFEARTVVLAPALVLLLGAVLAWGFERGSRGARATLAGASVVLAALVLLTALRHGAWGDDVTLEGRALAERPEDVDTALRRFRALAAANQPVDAWRAAGQAIEGRPLDGALRVEVADLVGAMAADASASARVGLDARRLRQVQAIGYQEALDAFARRAGHLTEEDRALRVYALARQLEVATSLGDLDLARSALELRLRLAHPEAQDIDEAVASAGWPARRDILLLALRALQPPPEGTPERVYAAARARSLTLAGLDPERPGDDLLEPWVEAMEAVRRDMEADGERAPDPEVWRKLATVLDLIGESDRAAALRARAE